MKLERGIMFPLRHAAVFHSMRERERVWKKIVLEIMLFLSSESSSSNWLTMGFGLQFYNIKDMLKLETTSMRMFYIVIEFPLKFKTFITFWITANCLILQTKRLINYILFCLNHLWIKYGISCIWWNNYTLLFASF